LFDFLKDLFLVFFLHNPPNSHVNKFNLNQHQNNNNNFDLRIQSLYDLNCLQFENCDLNNVEEICFHSLLNNNNNNNNGTHSKRIKFLCNQRKFEIENNISKQSIIVRYLNGSGKI
jgi:hypothetical protein